MKSSMVVLVILALLAASAAVGVEPATTRPAGGNVAQSRPSEEIETFVLTPIQVESFSMLVPAEVVGPVENRSCHNWPSHTESCYLPARRLDSPLSEQPQDLSNLLENHLSAVLETWKLGAWPADGATIDVPMEQYSYIQNVWLTHRIEIHESIAGCWLDGRKDPRALLAQVATQPAAELAVEVFAGTRSARGYPVKVRF